MTAEDAFNEYWRENVLNIDAPDDDKNNEATKVANTVFKYNSVTTVADVLGLFLQQTTVKRKRKSMIKKITSKIKKWFILRLNKKQPKKQENKKQETEKSIP